MVPIVLLTSSAPAHADGGSSVPAVLSWIKVKDSHGVSFWSYELSLDRGGKMSPGKMISSWVTDLLWQSYRGFIAVACWFLDWVLSMDWLTTVAEPVMTLGEGLHHVIAQIDGVTAALTVTAVYAVFWMARGSWALGAFEIGVAGLVAALATGILSNPVAMVAGDSGLLMGSRDASLELAGAMRSGGDPQAEASSEQMQSELVMMISETFIRAPHQMVNFGQMLDGTECEKAYNDALKDGPYGEDSSDLRDAVGDCNETAGEMAANPGTGMVFSAGALWPSGGIAVLFIFVLAGAILAAGVYALYQALKLIVALVAAMLPGASRGPLMMSLAELATSLALLVFTVLFLVGYMLFVEGFFAAEDGGNPMKSFLIVDLLLVVGIVVFLKGRKRLKGAAARLAAALSKRPGRRASATSLPSPTKLDYAGTRRRLRQGSNVAGKTAQATGHTLNSTGATIGRNAGKVGSGIGWVRGKFTTGSSDATGQPGPPADGPAPNPGDSSTPSPTPALAPLPAPGQRLTKTLESRRPRGSRTGQLARVAAMAGVSVATGGSSSVVAGLAKKATTETARRQLLRARLQGKPPVGSTQDDSLPGPTHTVPPRRASVMSRLRRPAAPTEESRPNRQDHHGFAVPGPTHTIPGRRTSPATRSPQQPTRSAPPVGTSLPPTSTAADPSKDSSTSRQAPGSAADRLQARLAARSRQQPPGPGAVRRPGAGRTPR